MWPAWLHHMSACTACDVLLLPALALVEDVGLILEVASVCAQYNALLALLDGVAGRQVDASLAALGTVLTEPAVARVLSRNLPPGEAGLPDAAC